MKSLLLIGILLSISVPLRGYGGTGQHGWTQSSTRKPRMVAINFDVDSSYEEKRELDEVELKVLAAKVRRMMEIRESVDSPILEN